MPLNSRYLIMATLASWNNFSDALDHIRILLKGTGGQQAPRAAAGGHIICHPSLLRAGITGEASVDVYCRFLPQPWEEILLSPPSFLAQSPEMPGEHF